MVHSSPLTADELAAEQNVNTPVNERIRLYARRLREHAECYAVAADAPGLRKDAARYLYAESTRLTRESGLWFDKADELDALAERDADKHITRSYTRTGQLKETV
jgi:hypothetical protein